MAEGSVAAVVDEWVERCRRRGGASRNTIAVGIVVLHHLRKTCPVARANVFSRGGELVGARSTLGRTLEEYGVPRSFLKEATNRQAAPFAAKLFEAHARGRELAGMAPGERDRLLTAGIRRLTERAREWLGRQRLRVSCDNNPGHAGDAQTGRTGDFPHGTTVYHVTAAPTRAVIGKCGANLAQGLLPILLVPREHVGKAVNFAQACGLDQRIGVFAIEDFVALNILEMAEGRDADFVRTLKEIVAVCNRRRREAETDLSLTIEVE